MNEYHRAWITYKYGKLLYNLRQCVSRSFFVIQTRQSRSHVLYIIGTGTRRVPFSDRIIPGVFRRAATFTGYNNDDATLRMTFFRMVKHFFGNIAVN